MSHPIEHDFNPGPINNYSQHPYPYPHAHAHPQHASQGPQHGLHQQHQQQHQPPEHQYFGDTSTYANNSHNHHTNNNGSTNSALHPLHHQEQPPQQPLQQPPPQQLQHHHHQPTFPVIPQYTRPTFDQGIPSYAAISSTSVVVPQDPEAQVANQTGVTELSHKPTWAPESETLSQQQNNNHIFATAAAGTGGTQDLAAGASSSYQPDPRYMKGPLDVLNAAQYGDGAYMGGPGSGPGPSKPEDHVLSAAVNPKKRGRKALQNDKAEYGEENKRARGRPRLETGDQHDMKARRKEQIRLAQRAYRNRKETAITDLEAKVSKLEAGNASINAEFQSLLMDYVEKNQTGAQDPELMRRLQQFQATLAERCSGTPSSGNEEMTGIETRPLQDTELPVEQSHPVHQQQQQQQQSQQPQHHQQQISHRPLSPRHISQQQQQQQDQLLGGIIVTHEPQYQSMGMNPFEDVGYTLVRVANAENASFSEYLPASYMDMSSVALPTTTNTTTNNPAASSSSSSNSSPPLPIPLSHNNQIPTPALFQTTTIPLPSSGAYLEQTLGRRLHRRMTERALHLLLMDNPHHEIMHRVFGFVRNYAPLSDIKARLLATVGRGGAEDLAAYAQPFHHVGGSGTHFAAGDRTVSFPTGAPFPSSGFGMGPFDERTMTFRDEFLDLLQRSRLRGWRGEWFDSYEVEQFLAEKGFCVPADGNGDDAYVVIEPGEFRDDGGDGIGAGAGAGNGAGMSGRRPSSLASSVSPRRGSVRVASASGSGSGSGSSRSGKNVAGSNTTNNNFDGAGVSGEAGVVIHSSTAEQQQQQALVRGGQYPSPVSSVDGVLSIPAAAAGMWPSGFLAGNNMSSVLAYHNSAPSSSSMGFIETSQHQQQHQQNQHPAEYPPTNMNLVDSQTHNNNNNNTTNNNNNNNKRVWFSVEKFIENLGTRATCVGLGPAFRKKDVIKAFWEAAKPDPR